ncbi:MAG TPA: hypothetical protein VNR87_08895 [Flavisolibacter sp.]|nr:hypothetical protein [Flavisolibacter sp.]
MKRNFTHENFEAFLQRNADGLRMRPSDKVWTGIARNLNRRRRIFGFTLGVSLLLLTGLGYYWNTYPTASSLRVSHPSQPVQEKISPQVHNEETSIAFQSSIPQQASLALRSMKPTVRINDVVENKPNAAENIFESPVADSYFGENKQEAATEQMPASLSPADPQTIESIVNSYRGRKGKVGLQIYFTPTVSYRKLSDDNIDNVVTHKPDFGFELGMAVKYPVSKNVKLRAGLQFNVNRYAIKTYNSSPQMATIRLSDRNGVDFVNTSTSYNNLSGYRSNWLENFYFGVAAPLGIEVKLRGDEKVQFGVASTLQPTYLLGDRAYLISTDYKYYAEVPRLIRHWNLNSNLETYVAYSTGHLKWQVGPQVRYQLLSSFVKKYPVKENLFDFGLKVGVSLNNK